MRAAIPAPRQRFAARLACCHTLTERRARIDRDGIAFLAARPHERPSLSFASMLADAFVWFAWAVAVWMFECPSPVSLPTLRADEPARRAVRWRIELAVQHGNTRFALFAGSPSSPAPMQVS